MPIEYREGTFRVLSYNKVNISIIAEAAIIPVFSLHDISIQHALCDIRRHRCTQRDD